MPRICHIEDAFIADASGGSDGAYDLFDVVGTPADIGNAIAAALATGNLFAGKSLAAAGQNLYLSIRVKFSEIVK